MEDGSKQCAKYIVGGGVVEKDGDGTLHNYYQLRLSRFLLSLSPLLTVISPISVSSSSVE